MEFYRNNAIGIGLEQPTADFIDSDLLEQPDPIYRIDSRGDRFYYTLDANNNPTFYGSVTSIKSQVSPTPKAFIDKQIQMGKREYRSYVENRQQLGTLFHILASEATIQGYFDFDTLQDRIDMYALGADTNDINRLIKRIKDSDTDFQSSEALIDIMRRPRKVEYTEARYGKPSWHYELSRGLMAWLQFMRDYDVKPIAVELSLWHPDGFANTIDLICSRYKNKYTDKTPQKNRKRINTVLDWKTGGIYSGHEVQLAFNRRSLRFHYPSLKVDKVENWTYRENSRTTPYYCKNQTDRCTEEQLDAMLQIWRQKGNDKPKDVEQLSGSISSENVSMDNYQSINIEEFIKQKHEQKELV